MGVAYTFFYLLTTWSLSYVTVAMNLPTKEWLLMLMLGVVLFGAMIVVASLFADRLGRKGVLVTGTVMIIAFALAFPFFLQGKGNVGGGIFFIFVGFFIYGIIYGPVGALLPELFPTATRYSGSGIAYNLAAIIGAAFAPTIASFLVDRYGIHSVGFYLALMAAISLVALLTTKETKSIDYTK